MEDLLYSNQTTSLAPGVVLDAHAPMFQFSDFNPFILSSPVLEGCNNTDSNPDSE